MDHSLIEAVFKNHSRSNAAITCLQDQLQSLEVLRDSSRRSFTALRKSDAELDRSTHNLLESSSRNFIPSPEEKAHVQKLAYLHANSPLYQVNSNNNNNGNSSQNKMHLSESQSPPLDLSTLLNHFSSTNGGPRSSGMSGAGTSSSGSSDELLSLLERISLTGHQLQLELQNAKIREGELLEQVKRVNSKKNGFSSSRKLDFNGFQENDYQSQNSPSVQNENEMMNNLNIRCEKLQDAMLSLQEENMKLNKILRDKTLVSDDSLIQCDGDHRKTSLGTSLTRCDSEIIQLRETIENLSEKLHNTENAVRTEKKKSASLERAILQVTEEAQRSRTTRDNGLRCGQEQLEKLSATLQKNIDSLQKENGKYMERIQILEKTISTRTKNESNLEAYNQRIDDLHVTLLAKEEKIKELEDKLARVTESLDGNKKATQKIHNNDISKRKEVLLLCEKYEQLKKNAKRLESDLHNSQKRLQEVTTKAWALETSCQKVTRENELLKGQFKALEKNDTVTMESNVSLRREYERLSEKYEALLNVRMEERDKIKRENTISRRAFDVDEVIQAKKLEQTSGERFIQGNDTLSESMKKRQRDFKHFYDDIPNRRTKSRSADAKLRYNSGQSLDEKETSRHPQNATDTKRRLTFEVKQTELYPSSKIMRPRTSEQDASRSFECVPTVTHENEKSKVKDSNFRTSTPVKTSSVTLEYSRRKFEDEKNSSLLNDRGKSQEKIANTTEKAQLRSQSLSPIRNFPADRSAERKGGNLSLSPETKKSVSFLTPTAPYRSRSTDSLLEKRNDIASRSKDLGDKKKNLSPVEVLEKVKSAYQEEYLKNMEGVNLSATPRKGYSSSKSKEAKTRVETGAEMWAERYKKNSANVKMLLDKNYGHEKDSSGSSSLSESENCVTKSPKSILKRPKNFMHNLQEDRNHDKSSSVPYHSDTPIPLVVREKSTNLPLQTYDIALSEMLKKKETSPKNYSYLFGKVLSAREKMGAKDGNSSDVDILEIEPTTVLMGRSFSESQETDDSQDDVSYTTARDMRSAAAVVPSAYQSENTKDLTTPAQLFRRLKDDETDSVDQSSTSSTCEHIGRFEFLQEMQSTLKSPAFSYQKPSVSDNIPMKDISLQTRPVDDATPEIGLSARQQEYADKLVVKYMKKSVTKAKC